MDKQSRLARTILNGFTAYFAEFENITLSARTRFENAEWRATQEASMRRIDIYKLQVLETIDVVEYIAQDRLHDLDFWAETRDLYAELVRGMTNFEIAETFYNSIFNAVFEHRWIRDDYAFVFSPQGDMPPVDVRRVLNQYRTKGDFKATVANLLFDYGMSLPYEDYDREVMRVTEVMTAAVEDAGYNHRADLELHALEHH
ncbi:MAG: isocitrate dehydrogenase kinase/phosphatase AceK regulatory subunit, partial [Pseudomonadota bacterium]|nr:isocitrate dehydrogenase kinase/phosphatase AceK regulatory subunit [Pseudomonadota bacterium]